MGVKSVITTVSQSLTCLAANPCYYATFSGTSFSAQLEVNINGDWIIAATAITATMPIALFTGRFTETEDALPWRWNVTAITAGTLTCYIG